MSIRKELNNTANKVNKIKEDKKRKVEQIVEEVLDEARLAADAGKYELYVDKWCGDYVPLAGEVYKELEKLGFTVYTGAAYCTYITWRRV